MTCPVVTRVSLRAGQVTLGERASDIAVGHTPQPDPQAADAGDIADYDKDQHGGAQRPGDPPPVQPAASPVLKR